MAQTGPDDLSGDDAAAERSKRWREFLAEESTCSCRRPLRLRRYLGHWLCKLCGKLRYSEAR